MQEALHIALVGIGYVFCFLSVLIFLLFLNSFLLQRLAARGKRKTEQQQDDQARLAAVTAVAEHHARISTRSTRTKK